MAAKKQRRGEMEKDRRVNIKFATEEEVKVYLEIKARASRKDMSLRDYVLELFRKDIRGK